MDVREATPRKDEVRFGVNREARRYLCLRLLPGAEQCSSVRLNFRVTRTASIMKTIENHSRKSALYIAAHVPIEGYSSEESCFHVLIC